VPHVPRVLFVCLHGSAKSVIAAEHLRRLAAQRGLALQAASAGLEPDAEIPPHVAAALLDEGIDVRDQRPGAVTAEAIGAADHVVSFGCDLGGLAPEGTAVTMWSDVPAVSDGYAAARADIVGRLVPLLDALTPLGADEPAAPRPTGP
jgi:arsenate reductase (thioredoxin)